MSFTADEAWKVARCLEMDLGPVTLRTEIAGSLRRRKPRVNDIEILFIPRLVDAKEDMFAVSKRDVADEAINLWLQHGLLAKREGKDGQTAWGKQNKLAVHVPSGIPVDFFSTTEEKWWNSLVCRTGGKDNNLMITRRALAKGWSFEAYGSGFHRTDYGDHHQTKSEEDVYAFLGLPYLQPWERR